MTENTRHETPDVAELRRLAEAATPGPWEAHDRGIVSETGDGYRRAGLSEDPRRRDECPHCRTDRPSPDTKPEGALL